MDAFNLLKADHRKVEELFARLESTSGKKKLDVFAQIKTELDLHAHLEEKIFYPALEKPTETRDIILEAYEEHKQVKTLLRELSRAKNADEEWQAKAKVLQENVEHHVQEEETELFKKARRALSKEEVEELGQQLEIEKAHKQAAAASKSAPAKKTSAKKRPATKAAKKSGGSEKRTSTKSARTSK
jgi:hemerythrin-like domain-containing protein